MSNLNIAEVSSDPAAKSRKTVSTVLQRLAQQGMQGRIAAQLQVDDSTVSRWKGDLERTALILAHLGLKVVPDDKVCVPASEIAFLRRAYTRVTEQAPWLLNEGDE